MSVAVHPTKLEMASPSLLVIDWSDGERRQYTLRELRDRCPCATCREKRQKPAAPPNPFQVLKPEEARPLAIKEMSPVGNYAYSIAFSDGHDTGIFTLEFLRELGSVVTP